MWLTSVLPSVCRRQSMTGKRSSSLPAMGLGTDACVVLLLLTSVGCVALGNHTERKTGSLLRQLRPNLLACQERLNPLPTGKPWLFTLGCLVSDVPSDPGNVCRTSAETVIISTRPPDHEPTVNTEHTRLPLYSKAASGATGGSDKPRGHLVSLEAHRPQNSSWVRSCNSGANRQVERFVNKFHKVNNRAESVLARGVQEGREVEDVIAAIRHRRLPSQEDKKKKRRTGSQDTRSKADCEKRAFAHDVQGDVASDTSLSVTRVFSSEQNSGASISSLHRQSHAFYATFNNNSSSSSSSSSSSRALTAVTFEPAPRRGRRDQTLLLPDNHQVRANYFTAGETCRTELMIQTLQPSGCRPMIVPTKGCRGTCHSRSVPEWHFETQQVRNVEYCTCCKPHQQSRHPVVFQCPGLAAKTLEVLSASTCACRPCSHGNVVTRPIYD